MSTNPLDYIMLTLPFGVAFLLAAGVIALVLGMYRSPVVAIVSILLLSMWEGAAYQLPGITIGLTLYPQDALFTIIGLCTLIRIIMQPHRLRGTPYSLSALLLILATSVCMGLAINSTRAGVEFRSDFYFWIGCLYFLTFEATATWFNQLKTWLRIAALLLCAVVWYRLCADALDLRWFDPIWRNADATDVIFKRVAPASVAFIVGLGTLTIASDIGKNQSRPISYVLLPVFLLTVLILQHRSVWVALAGALLIQTAIGRGLNLSTDRRKVPWLPIAGSVVVIAAIYATGLLGKATDSIAQQAAAATDLDRGTFAGRVEGWQALISSWSRSGIRELLIGQPYGSGYTRHQGGLTVNYSPHNYYVAILLRGGIVGGAALLLVLYYALRQILRRTKNRSQIDFSLLCALLLFMILYWIPYSPTYPSCLILGTVLSVAKNISGKIVASVPEKHDRIPGKWRANQTSPASQNAAGASLST